MPELLGVTSLVFGFLVVLVLAFRYWAIREVLVCAFLARAALACVHYWLFPLPYGVHDAAVFERIAWKWGQEGFWHAFTQFNPAASFVYSWLASLLYALTGRSALMLQGINVLGGTLIVFHSYLIAKELWGERRAKVTAWFVAVFPFLVQVAAVTHREVVIVYFLTLGVLFLVRWGHDSTLRHLVLAFGFLLASTILHGGMISVVLGAGLFVFWSTFGLSLKRFLVGRIRIPAFVTVLLMLTIAAGSGIVIGETLRLSTVGDLTSIDVEVFTRMVQDRARGEAAYLENVYPTSFFDIAWQAPLRIIYFLISPFPWHISSVSHAVAMSDVALHLVVFLGLWRSRHLILNDRGALAVVAVLIVAIGAFAVVTSNFGTAMRHRAKFLPIFAALWAVPVFRIRFVLLRNKFSETSTQSE
ncbi:glycosyltransferase family 39 protein [Salinibacter sp.]|jgi:hypothetical protein|uniref:glycosyltransferase family 39 protein n=1 Tax=Salinibacter sp. TaxID=2065818 RepID=UPI0021E7028D|nr:glycosyltransferase family 39 protein [Salinibacter sp.]